MNMHIRSIFQPLLAALLALGLVTPATAIETVTYLHADHLGSPIAATNSKGQLTWHKVHEPYGKRADTAGPETNSTTALGYTGHADDTESGLTYMQARYYDPMIGRFLVPDPAHFMESNPQSFNRYAYGNNNPHRFIDPDGNSPIDLIFWAADGVKLGMAAYTGVGVGSAAVDFGISTASLFSPVPGVGQAIKAARFADRSIDAARAVDKMGDAAKEAGILANGARGRAAEARVLEELGLAKNTRAVSTAEGRAIPDALTDSLSIEIKDTLRVNAATQIRIQTDAAKAAGRESVLITGERTCISGECARRFDQVIRRSDLGPQ